MATPLFDALNQEFSYTLQDPVAAAANDGVTYTSAVRTSLLNRASASLWNMLYFSAKKTFRTDNFKYDRFRDFLIDVTGATDASGRISIAALTKTYLTEIIELVGTATPAKRLKVIGKGEVGLVSSSAIDPQYIPSANNPLAYINGAYVYLLPAASYNAQDYRMVYLVYPQTNAVGGADSVELEWGRSFRESLKLLGLAHALLDDGNAQGYQMVYQSVAQEYMQDITEMQEYKKT